VKNMVAAMQELLIKG